MTGDLFLKVLEKINFKMIRERRSIILFVDNRAAHLSAGISFSNVKVVVLLPNTTSVLQPMDAGVIKGYYRLKLARKLIQFVENESVGSNQVKFYEACEMAVSSWNDLTYQTINCFRHCGFYKAKCREEEIDTAYDEFAQIKQSFLKIVPKDEQICLSCKH